MSTALANGLHRLGEWVEQAYIAPCDLWHAHSVEYCPIHARELLNVEDVIHA